MPRRRRVAKARDQGTHVAELPPNDKWEQLMTGEEFRDGTSFPGEGSAREAAIHAAWELNREAFIIAGRERYGPGWRPWGWWEYDAPKTIRAAIPPWVRSRVLEDRGGKHQEYLTLMRQFGLLTPEERTALGV